MYLYTEYRSVHGVLGLHTEYQGIYTRVFQRILEKSNALLIFMISNDIHDFNNIPVCVCVCMYVNVLALV